MTMTDTYDVAVIGGGHNALVTATYLARAGRRVVVLERRERVGGAAETAELGGVRVPRLAHTVGRLRPSVVRDLWLCGSATHPGGGIMGANGRIAAMEVLRARGRRAA